MISYNLTSLVQKTFVIIVAN